MPTRRHSRAKTLADPEYSAIREQAPQEQAPALPPELEARIAALEAAESRADFDVSGWFWMILLGFAIPAALLIVGWRT
jgi:hypothetical protein